MVRGVLFPAVFLAAAAVQPTWAQGLDLSQGGAIDVTASDGMEWRQDEQLVIARGDARAIRGNATVTADTLIARYRRKAGATTVAPASTTASTPGARPASPGEADTGANEIYRLEAQGHVKIFTATDLAVGDKAIYDIDQAVLVLTGDAMTLTTPQQVMTARDTMEYWSQKHMAVGRGLAVVTTNDGRRVSGDVIVGFTQPPPGTPPAPPGAKQPPAPPPQAGKPAGDLIGASGKLQRIEGFGHVQVRTATETITGDRGVYVSATEVARLAGNVHVTRGQNQLEGDEALVNMRTGISTLVRDPGKRVQGLVMPNDATGKADPAKSPSKGAAPSTPGQTR